MPKLISYTPLWLQRPGPGFDAFTSKPKQSHTTNGLVKATQRTRSKRTIATKGSEVFYVVGNEIRWTDLVYLKEKGEAFFGLGQPQDQSALEAQNYRVLKASIHGTIQELRISPGDQAEFLAIVTSHTIYIAVLPSSDLFGQDDNAPLKLKTFQLGPTAHVLEESPIASVLWHPLGYRGRCILTITEDAVVRLWELNRADRSSFADPALAVDLKKLANATSAEEDLGASKYGVSKGFSPDSAELEVVAACFGDSPEQEGVHGWAPMTLWIATREGGVYALCPLLPSKWQLARSPSASYFLQTLNTSINSNYSGVYENRSASEEDKRTSKQQLSWLYDIVYQEPVSEQKDWSDAPVDIYSRPKSTPIIPRLQGPFFFAPDFEDDFEVSDIIAFGLKTLTGGDVDEAAEGHPMSIVCLVTSNCEVRICLDLEGIQGRWLPTGTVQLLPDEYLEHALLAFETVKLLPDNLESYQYPATPTVTPDKLSDYSFFVSHDSGVYFVSFASWATKLEQELRDAQVEGAEFRLNLLLEGAESVAEIMLPLHSDPAKQAHRDVKATAIIDDSDVGYFLLSTSENEVLAATLDRPNEELPLEDPAIASYMGLEAEGLPRVELRQPYQPPGDFWTDVKLTQRVEGNIPARRKGVLKDEVRLSPATLDVLMDAHRILSQDTHRLGLAVADLFTRCERLKDEFRAQVFRTADLKGKVDRITGDDEKDSESDVVGSKKIEERLKKARENQDELTARYDRIQKKLGKVGGRELSEKEEDWIAEINTMERALDPDAGYEDGEEDGGEIPTWQRIEELKALHKDLIKQAKDAIANSEGEEQTNSAPKVTSEPKKRANEEVEKLLSREEALVESAREKLKKLGIEVASPS